MFLVSVPLAVLILVVTGITILAVKVGAVALRLTGLDDDRAFFQALSAVTGTGFTTSEAEVVVNDPRRRKVIIALMILGNVVLVTVISLLIGMFATSEKHLNWGVNVLLLLIGGLVLYWLLVKRAFAMRWAQRLGEKVAFRLRMKTRPVHELLDLAEGFSVAELVVEPYMSCSEKSLAEAGLRQAGLLVLAVRRIGGVVPNPRADFRIQPGDRLICYGRIEKLEAFASPGAHKRRAEEADGAGEAANQTPGGPEVVDLRSPKAEDVEEPPENASPGPEDAGGEPPPPDRPTD